MQRWAAGFLLGKVIHCRMGSPPFSDFHDEVERVASPKEMGGMLGKSGRLVTAGTPDLWRCPLPSLHK